jgi:hypothetical protein
LTSVCEFEFGKQLIDEFFSCLNLTIMLPEDRQSEKTALQHQLLTVSERFDLSLNNMSDLSETKKLFHELRKLQEKLDTLNQQYFDAL